MASRLESCLIRIHSVDGIVGTGFLVSEKHVMTCAHVVASALGCPADEIVNKKVNLDFPLVEGVPKTSAVVQFSSCVEGHSERDIAGLRLCKGKASLNGATPTRLVKLRDYRGRVVDLFGCPLDHPKGDWILDAVLSNPVHSSRVQLEIRGNLANPVRPGFSGGPVWDKNEQAIVGMIVEANEKYGTGEMIPVTVLAETWDVVRRVATVLLARLSNVPPLPPQFVSRPEYMEPLKAKLLGESDKVVAVTATGSKKTGVQGMGGIGKTVLATAAVRDEDVRRAYPDGVIWLTLGQQANLVSRQIQLANALGDSRRAFQDAQEGKAWLEEHLDDKACLIVLDDVWKDEHTEAFDALGEQCQMLITTRHKDVVAALEAQELQLDVLEEKQALVLLSKWVGMIVERLPKEAHEIVKECGRLPLALAMIGAMIRRRPERWDNALQLLRDADLEEFKREFSGYPYPNLFRAMAVSVDALEDQDKERYLDFAVFPEDTPIPEAVLQILWQVDGLRPYKIQRFLDQLQDRSLLRRDQAGRITLHDLQLDYVTKEVGEGLVARHRKLLDAYRAQCTDGWHTGPDDGYFYQHLAYHFCLAGQQDQLRRLLFNYRWLERKLDVTNPNELVEDYTFLPGDTDLKLVQRAIRLSSIALAEDASYLASQLYGRLVSERGRSIQSLLDEVVECQKGLWLRPLSAGLAPAGGPLVRTFHKPIGCSMSAVAVTPDGRYVVSGSYNRDLKKWDLQSGKQMLCLAQDECSLLTIAVTPDGQHAVCGSDGGTLLVWDLTTGKKVYELKGHAHWVQAVAVTRDGRYAVSGSYDKTLIIWDLATGKKLRQLTGHMDAVLAVSVTPDGRHAVSGSSDKTLMVWDLQSGKHLRKLCRHDGAVRAVVVTSDGRYVVSGADDKTLKLWDLKTGEVLCSLKGHTDCISAVAVTGDGRFAVSGSCDKMLKVWDLKTGKELCSMTGHTGPVWTVAVTPDGKFAASGSNDGTLRLWHLKTRQKSPSLQGHTDRVYAVAVTPDGSHTVSASLDKTLKVWDLKTGRKLRTLQNRPNAALAVAVTPDGRHAVSGSNDKMLVIWDLQTGKKLRRLQGHAAAVQAVAVTPDGRYAISGSSDHARNLKVWDLETTMEIGQLTGHMGWVYAVAVTPDGRYAVSGSADGTVRLWDLKTSKELHRFIAHDGGVRAVAVTADGRYAVSGSEDKTLIVWDLTTGKKVGQLKGHADAVKAVTVTSDGRYILSGSDDMTLKVWDLQSRKVVATFRGENPILCCGVAPDSVSIVAGEESGTVHFLRLENVS